MVVPNRGDAAADHQHDDHHRAPGYRLPTIKDAVVGITIMMIDGGSLAPRAEPRKSRLVAREAREGRVGPPPLIGYLPSPLWVRQHAN
jgi:hypothetical protein